MKTTLRELLHAINILGEDRDVTVDGEGGIAVCPPVELTPEGLERFHKALEATVEVEYENGRHCDTYVSDDDEDVNEEAWFLLTSLAGYCAYSKFKLWFVGEAAKMI